MLSYLHGTKILSLFIAHYKASLATQVVKNPPATQETWVQSLGREDPLEKAMATHCSILAWRTTDRGAWQVTVRGIIELDMTERLTTGPHRKRC